MTATACALRPPAPAATRAHRDGGGGGGGAPSCVPCACSGSNDLTMLALGADRDAGDGLGGGRYDERDPAVKALMSMAVSACAAAGKYSGVCGQACGSGPGGGRSRNA